VTCLVIVGAGLAGVRAAGTLRKAGFDGRVVLIGEEATPPYDRPPLSKAYLQGSVDFDRLALHKAGYYESHGIELLIATRAVSLDVAARAVELSTGERLVYDGLLLATGARPRRLSVPGAELGGVCYLRDIHHAEHLRSAIGPDTNLVVIGAGWIGCEVAAVARSRGAAVALVDVVSQPLARVLGPEVGAIYARLHATNGVSLHLGVGVESLRGAASVQEVRLTDGTVLAADLVVVGVGVTPCVELAQAGGLEVAHGIVVDQHLATSAPGIWAAGDAASVYHPRYGSHICLEHWAGAAQQAPVAARNMIEGREVYERIPYFWSDQYDLTMEYNGWAPSWEQVVIRGDPESGGFVAFWLSRSRIVAGMSANVEGAAGHVEALVGAGAVVDPAQLADVGVSLSAIHSSLCSKLTSTASSTATNHTPTHTRDPHAGGL
jgi:3-phenylpropionate/trans-cinnamate dioxygenase ferredoxin reductase subunit